MNWKTITTETRNCPQHGDYQATQLELDGSQAPKELREHWTNCPNCDQLWAAQAQQLREELIHNKQARELAHLAMIEQAGIPKRFKDVTLWGWLHPMDQQAHVFAWAKNYVDRFDKDEPQPSVAFIGSPGTGKTHLGIGIAIHLMQRKNVAAKYTTVMDMIGDIRNTYNRQAKTTEHERVQHFASIDLLVLDEIGKQLDSDHEQTQLFRILDTRYREMKPTIFISNLSKQKFTEFLGDAVVDRMREHGGKILGFTWDSYRSKKVRRGGDE